MKLQKHYDVYVTLVEPNSNISFSATSNRDAKFKIYNTLLSLAGIKYGYRDTVKSITVDGSEVLRIEDKQIVYKDYFYVA